jgi:hypothetical protein
MGSTVSSNQVRAYCSTAIDRASRAVTNGVCPAVLAAFNEQARPVGGVDFEATGEEEAHPHSVQSTSLSKTSAFGQADSTEALFSD